MPKSIEDIDRQIAALKEQNLVVVRNRHQLLELCLGVVKDLLREGLRSCKELIGEKVVNAFDNWTSIDLDLFAMYISEHADEIVTTCSTSETDLDDALKRNKQFAKKHKKTRKKTNDRDEPESDSDSSEQDDTQVDSYAVPYGAYRQAS